jgi:hypothetical protein
VGARAAICGGARGWPRLAAALPARLRLASKTMHRRSELHVAPFGYVGRLEGCCYEPGTRSLAGARRPTAIVNADDKAGVGARVPEQLERGRAEVSSVGDGCVCGPRAATHVAVCSGQRRFGSPPAGSTAVRSQRLTKSPGAAPTGREERPARSLRIHSSRSPPRSPAPAAGARYSRPSGRRCAYRNRADHRTEPGLDRAW